MKLFLYRSAIALSLLSVMSLGAPTNGKKYSETGDGKGKSGEDQGSRPHAISFPTSRPSDATTVPQDFVGFGYASAFLDSYNNDFSRNLINSVADRMSAPPIVRIGGTEGDHLTFDPRQKAIKKCRHGKGKKDCGSTFIIGPSYFEGFKDLGNAHVTFQAPLGPGPPNKTNIKEYVTRTYKAAGPDKVAAIAIGNEVAKEKYEKTPGEYVRNVTRVEQIVTEALGLSPQERIFEVLDLADHQVSSQKPWTLQEAFKQGLDDNSRVKFAAEHWYQINKPASNIQKHLLNHKAITTKFDNYSKAITFLNSNHKQVDFVLSESGSTLGSRNPFAEHFATTLWSVDFQLYAMTQGVKRVAGTQRPEARHSLWLPSQGKSKPQVQAAYYAQPFVADFIGKTSRTDVVNMPLDSEIMSTYAAYGPDGKLARVALVNLREWNRGASEKADGNKNRNENGNRNRNEENQRGHRTFALKVPNDINSVKVGKLSAPTGAKAGGIDNGGAHIMWQGQQWSYKLNNGKVHPTSPKTEVVKVNDGKALVKVEDSEAVIVYLR